MSYKAKQKETLARECHLVEIDFLGTGGTLLCIPEWRVKPFEPFDSLCCVSRWPSRNRLKLYPAHAQTTADRACESRSPMKDPDAVVAPPDVQAALEQVYAEGRYARRVRYDEKCQPRLSSQDQGWADERIATFRTARPDVFPG